MAKKITDVPQEEILQETEVPKKTNREVFLENLKAKYPDIEDEDDYYKLAMEGYDEKNERLKSIIASNQSLADRLIENPQAGAAFKEFLDGKPLPVAMRKYFSDEEMSINEGDEGYEQFLEDRKEKIAQIEKNKAFQAEIEANLEASVDDIDRYAEETGRNEEEMNDFLNQIDEAIIQPVAQCKLSFDFLQKAEQFLNYSTDVATAEKVGYTKGKNEKIIEKRKTAEQAGLPNLAGSSAVEKPAPKLTDRLDRIVNKKDIWERGR